MTVKEIFDLFNEEEKKEMLNLLLKSAQSKGGKAKTASKAAASRENGKKGGRPKRVSVQIEPKLFRLYC